MNFRKLLASLCAMGALAGCSTQPDQPSAPPADQPAAPKPAPPVDSVSPTTPTVPPKPKTNLPKPGTTLKIPSGTPPQPGSPDPKKTYPARSGPKLPDNVPAGEMAPGSDREAVYFNACRALVDHIPNPKSSPAGSLSFPDRSKGAKVVSNGNNKYTVTIDAKQGKTEHEWTIVLVKDAHGTFQTESVN